MEPDTVGGFAAMHALPDVITHTFHARRGALRNVCALCDAGAERVLDAIRADGTARLRPGYLKKRRATEDWLIAERTRLLGPAPMARPVYFFLGDFADGLDPARPCALVVPLAAFAPEMLTFTYSDSMTSFALARHDCHRADRKPHHGRLFTLAGIERLVADIGMPDRTGARCRFDRFIEVQVWDTAPLRLTLHPRPNRMRAP